MRTGSVHAKEGEKYWRRTVGTIMWHYDKLASPAFHAGRELCGA